VPNCSFGKEQVETPAVHQEIPDHEEEVDSDGWEHIAKRPGGTHTSATEGVLL
jgi:hypothetical protein